MLGTCLEILGYPTIANLAVAAGLAEATRSIESPVFAPFFTSDASLPTEPARYFGQFDLIVSYLHDPDQTFVHRLASVTQALILTGPHRPSETAAIHAVQSLMRPLEELGVCDIAPEPELRFSAPAPCQREFANARWIAIHPGSGSPRKNWPESSWAELLKELLEKTSDNLLLVGGEAEEGRLKRLAQTLPANRVRLADNIPLTELAQQLRCGSLFVGHDSGITHLAAALGLPVVALWGESNAQVWHPASQKAVLLRHPSGLDFLAVSTVAQAVQAAVRITPQS